jgi:hypothetical protein
MANLTKATLTRVGRMLGGAEGATPLAKLVAWSRIPRKTLYNWTLTADDPQYRTMSPMAKRMVVLLAYFAMCGQLTSQRLNDIEALEAMLDDELTFQKAARRLNRLLAGLDLAPGKEAAAEAAPHEAHGEDEDKALLAAIVHAETRLKEKRLPEVKRRRAGPALRQTTRPTVNIRTN